MIDVMENIKKLSAALDAETASLHPSGKLLLFGSQDSVFLKAIKRKADQLGINCDHTSNPLPPYRGIVVDSETVSFNSILDPDVDIDHSYSPGMSAVSQAVMDLLIESGLVWEKDITIVGRGHAVKELAKYLDFNNATVTPVCPLPALVWRTTTMLLRSRRQKPSLAEKSCTAPFWSLRLVKGISVRCFGNIIPTVKLSLLIWFREMIGSDVVLLAGWISSLRTIPKNSTTSSRTLRSLWRKSSLRKLWRYPLAR